MSSASKVMYTIGRVFNIIAIIGCLIVLILGIVVVAAPSVQESLIETEGSEVDSLDAAKAMGIALIIAGAVTLVVYSVICGLAGHARKALNNGKKDNAPHILMIIIGVFGDIFYLLGGIFGLVAESQAAQERENNN